MMWYVPVSAAASATTIVIMALFARHHNTHVTNPLAQTIAIRCAIFLGLYGGLFFLEFLNGMSNHEASAAHVVIEAINSILDSIIFQSVFYLILVQIGGTERAIESLAKRMTIEIPTTSLAQDSPKFDGNDYDQVRAARSKYTSYRYAILWFIVMHPILATLIAFNDVEYAGGNAIRVVLAIINLAITTIAIVAWLQLVARLSPDISPKFNLKGKGVIMLGILLLRSMQSSVYYACIPIGFRVDWYWTLCLLQLVILVAGYARAFSASTFHAMSHSTPPLFRFWDVTAHPVPEYRTLHDALASEFAGAATTKGVHIVF